MYVRDKSIKDISDKNELYEIIRNCKVCHVGFVDNNVPYILAFNFGFDGKSIILHCAKEGRKINILAKNNNVCIEFDAFHEIFARHPEVACSWRMRYKSVIINGKAEIVDDYNDKVKYLNIFMQNYSDQNFIFNPPSVNNINIVKVDILEISGRKFEYI